MGEPPSFVGAVHDNSIWPKPGPATTLIGESGIVGVVAEASLDWGLSPITLTADTW